MTAAPIAERALLEVDALSVSYGEAKAVANVSFRLERGRAVAVLGANGAGKSSLAAALVGVVRPTSGRVVFDGVDITRRPSYRASRAGIAYVPEGRGIYPHLTVADNLRAMLRYAVPRRDREDALDRAGNAAGRPPERCRAGSSRCSRWRACSPHRPSCSSPTRCRSASHR
jgi:branched-chain amino acid transport system ATP-binding protein